MRSILFFSILLTSFCCQGQDSIYLKYQYKNLSDINSIVIFYKINLLDTIKYHDETYYKWNFSVDSTNFIGYITKNKSGIKFLSKHFKDSSNDCAEANKSHLLFLYNKKKFLSKKICYLNILGTKVTLNTVKKGKYYYCKAIRKDSLIPSHTYYIKQLVFEEYKMFPICIVLYDPYNSKLVKIKFSNPTGSGLQ